MFSLLAAVVGVAAAVFQTAAGGPHPQTLYTLPNTTVAAFARDGDLVAWFAPSRKRCNEVHVLSLANGLNTTLPKQTSGARNVTCRWDTAGTHVGIALGGTNAIWTLGETSPIPFDYLIGASVADPRERRFQEIAHTTRGSGLWLTGISGDGATLVYSVTSVDYVDEAGCLAGTGTCDLKIVGGGVYRMSGRDAPKLVAGTDHTGAVAVSASSGAVAYVPASAVGKDGHPLAVSGVPVEIVDPGTGSSIAHVTTQGVPLAIALTPKLLATLERTTIGLRIAWYDRATGSAAGSVPVSAKASPELTATDRTIVYRVGRSIRAVDVASHDLSSLARAAAVPVGLSLEGRRLAWAENLKSTARIRTLAITP